ncbi:hypothetical protein F4775DRAFT_281726 [Biscogniauxia sp. FL1348]|nr:hypothetical protein F4775DRAFT_281726 [Biscogniauxia sp. FL1348]
MVHGFESAQYDASYCLLYIRRSNCLDMRSLHQLNYCMAYAVCTLAVGYCVTHMHMLLITIYPMYCVTAPLRCVSTMLPACYSSTSLMAGAARFRRDSKRNCIYTDVWTPITSVSGSSASQGLESPSLTVFLLDIDICTSIACFQPLASSYCRVNGV